jgi:hypothetical protein
MNGHKKRFSLGWMVGVAVGLGSSAALVYAVTVPHSFSNGDTASAAQVNANFEALAAAINGSGACTGNHPGDEMVRVGSSCVDKHRAALFEGTAANAAAVTAMPAGCNANGSGCSGVVAQSRADAGGALSGGNTISWARATTACANAGKRLATASEIIAASTTGAVTFVNNDTIWVDAASAAASGTPVRGTHLGFVSGGFQLLGVNTPYTETQPGWGGVQFRCAR